MLRHPKKKWIKEQKWGKKVYFDPPINDVRQSHYLPFFWPFAFEAFWSSVFSLQTLVFAQQQQSEHVVNIIWLDKLLPQDNRNYSITLRVAMPATWWGRWRWRWRWWWGKRHFCEVLFHFYSSNERASNATQKAVKSRAHFVSQRLLLQAQKALGSNSNFNSRVSIVTGVGCRVIDVNLFVVLVVLVERPLCGKR